MISSGIFDVVESEFVFTGGCDGCAGISPGSLEALVTVAVGVFLATVRLDAARVEAFNYRLDSMFCSVRNSAIVASGIVLSSSILIMNRTSIVACMGHLLGGHQKCPVPHGRQLLLNSRGLCDATKILHSDPTLIGHRYSSDWGIASFLTGTAVWLLAVTSLANVSIPSDSGSSSRFI